MNDQVSQLEQRVRERARAKLRGHVEHKITALLAALPQDAGIHRVDTSHLAGLRAQLAPGDRALEPISVQITVHAARTLLLEALVAAGTAEAETAALEELLLAAAAQEARKEAGQHG